MPYICNVCGAALSRKYDLEHRHAKIHTGEAYEHFCPYPECPRSTRGFSQKGNLNTHINSKHAQGAARRWYYCRRAGCTGKFLDASVRSRHEKNTRAHNNPFVHWSGASPAAHPTQPITGDVMAPGQASGPSIQGYGLTWLGNMQQNVNLGETTQPVSSNQVPQAPLPPSQAFQIPVSSTVPSSSAVDNFMPAPQPGLDFDRRSSSTTTFQSSTPFSTYGQEQPLEAQAIVKPDPEDHTYPQTQTGTSAIYESSHTAGYNVDVDDNHWFPPSSNAEAGSSTSAARQDFQDQLQSSGAGPGPSSSSNPNSHFFGYHQWDKY
ncbi:uncharacterized protein FOMMEDRAFT_168673 [Fomitiporia mediterranea MF3/22]|uniref:uncharacterized protein n=1 Tax=Fomitiporia mediterranea (strain MF3/22) TaxID=694068 RepID=UPI000440751A|nr:uncharacterized protein FOMMEDRAFT_168673 [Fomitiporia mediterranea MF3/22]EJD02142.1 hypothetical protein FOMMEDRAFT_168673 [Fomitiporia mediterranea MF3/22]